MNGQLPVGIYQLPYNQVSLLPGQVYLFYLSVCLFNRKTVLSNLLPKIQQYFDDIRSRFLEARKFIIWKTWRRFK